MEQAIVRVEEVLSRDPFAHDWFWDVCCLTLVVAGRYEGTLAAFERMMIPAPWTYAYAAIAQVNLGNLDRARELAARFREAAPNMSVEDYFRIDPYVDPAVPERLTADLKKVI